MYYWNGNGIQDDRTVTFSQRPHYDQSERNSQWRLLKDSRTLSKIVKASFLDIEYDLLWYEQEFEAGLIGGCPISCYNGTMKVGSSVNEIFDRLARLFTAWNSVYTDLTSDDGKSDDVTQELSCWMCSEDRRSEKETNRTCWLCGVKGHIAMQCLVEHSVCLFCGGKHRSEQACRAVRAYCRKCGNKGHYARCCRVFRK